MSNKDFINFRMVFNISKSSSKNSKFKNITKNFIINRNFNKNQFLQCLTPILSISKHVISFRK